MRICEPTSSVDLFVFTVFWVTCENEFTSVPFDVCCFWCHAPSWPGTVATFGHHRVDKYAMDCFGTYTSTPGTASVHTLHMPKPVMWNVFSVNSVLKPRLWDYVYQFVYRHNKDLWETIWQSKTTFCVVVHISRTSYKNRKTSDCVVNHMILDYANVWHHRASRRRVTLFFPPDACMTCIIQIRNTMTTTQKIRECWQFRERTASGISS